jgi:hypothetical protein
MALRRYDPSGGAIFEELRISGHIYDYLYSPRLHSRPPSLVNPHLFRCLTSVEGSGIILGLRYLKLLRYLDLPLYPTFKPK